MCNYMQFTCEVKLMTVQFLALDIVYSYDMGYTLHCFLLCFVPTVVCVPKEGSLVQIISC